MLTATTEDYLKHLYLEEQRLDGNLVPNGTLAALLGVTPGTATAMVKTLADAGLVEHVSHRGARVTDKGASLALHVIRRHRLIEKFLVEILGFDWSEVHDEAEALEHVVSENLLHRLEQKLGYPTHDPHGEPIPDADGEMAERSAHSLADCVAGSRVTISRIDDREPSFLRFADDHGLRPGTALDVEQMNAVSDSVQVRPEQSDAVVLGIAAARRIFVELWGENERESEPG
ncbi:MAG: metal-dependent transcriptional regulator [Planctomycetes bacterium]|nr:metal-dependent transcriptional regulator [Planctomycetota bacterium]NOG55501.1 metal-dependent transcriptional regulator [Planctomycetota bacterium]